MACEPAAADARTPPVALLHEMLTAIWNLAVPDACSMHSAQLAGDRLCLAPRQQLLPHTPLTGSTSAVVPTHTTDILLAGVQ